MRPAARGTIRLRELRIADVAAAAKLVADMPLWQRYRYGEARCTRDLRTALERQDRLVVAVSAEAPVGLAWVLPLGGFGRLPYLKILAVHESAREQGAGAALLSAAEAGGDLLLLVSDFNRKAQRFYRAQGYRRVGGLTDLVLPGVTELLFLKRAGVPIAPSRPRPRPGPAPGRPATVRSRAR